MTKHGDKDGRENLPEAQAAGRVSKNRRQGIRYPGQGDVGSVSGKSGNAGGYRGKNTPANWKKFNP